MSDENGPGMFSQLQTEIDMYNQSVQPEGQAKFQIYESMKEDENSPSSKSDDEFTPPPEKKAKPEKCHQNHQPLFLAICTPLMVRANENIWQPGET